MLRGLGFVLIRAVQKRHERHVDEQAVLSPDLEGDLSDRLDKWLRLDVADRAPDLCDDDIRARLFADTVDKALDFVRDVRDHLHGRSHIRAFSFLVENVPVDPSRREVGEAVQILVDEALVVTEVEIRLRAVLRHENFAVLIRAHRAGIDIAVGIQLLRGHLEPSRLEKPAERSRRNALAEP